MKNRLFSVLAVIVLVLSLCCAGVLADENDIVPFAMGSYTAGTYIDQLLTETDEGWFEVISGSVPYGLEIVSENSYGSNRYSLRGTLMYEGNYSFDAAFRVGSEIMWVLRCSISVTPAVTPPPAAPETPIISCSENVSIIPGFAAEVRVSAYVNDGGSLTYQWYSGDGSPVAGGNGSSLVVMPETPGTYYYCCGVTNNNFGSQSTAFSQYITVTVEAPRVSSISVRSLPSKTEYLTGESLNTSGLQIAVRYDNGSYDYLSYGFDVPAWTFYTPGTQNITVSYQGCSTSFSVYVKDANKQITGISIASWPSVTSYTVGDYIDTTGLVLRVSTAGTPYEASSGFTVNPQRLSNQGTQTITVSYQGFTCSFNVNVKAEEKEGIAIGSMPKILTYSVGDTLDTTGLVLSVYKGAQKRDIISGFTCSPTTLTKIGVQEITVNYNGMTASFRVTVNGGEPAHTTAPTPTPAPGDITIGGNGAIITPKPSETPVIISTLKPTPEPDRTGSGPKTAVVVVLVVAIIALAGLCGYAYIVDRKKRSAQTHRRR